MAEHTSNDNDIGCDPPSLPGSGAHGQAAMLLVESLLHGLVARSIISVADAVEIVGVAVDVTIEMAADGGHPHASMEKSRTVLEAIRASLALDLPD